MKFLTIVTVVFLFLFWGNGCYDRQAKDGLSQKAEELEKGIDKVMPTMYFKRWEAWKDAFASLLESNEKLVLLEKLVCYLKEYDYSQLSTVEAQMAYDFLNDMLFWTQEQYFALTRDRGKMLDVWFCEMEILQKELQRCQEGLERFAGQPNLCIDYTDRINTIVTVKAKTYCYIDFERCRAHIYCTEHPEKKKAFLKRVKKVLGRYPEWYKEEK